VQVYLDLVVLLNFLVDFLLIVGVNRLCGAPAGIARAALGGMLGGIYAGICMLPEFRFLGNTLWRGVSLICICAVTFGLHSSAIRRGALFVLLSMALGGIALGLGNGGFWGILLGAGSIVLLCAFGLNGKLRQRKTVEVELVCRGVRKKLTALWDTGNELTDPITGERVLVAGADIAWEIFGLSKNQLLTPVQTMESGSYSGLRLIPYRAVGKEGGMLLAAKMDKVMINGVSSGKLVAFAPEIIGRGEQYQALTGG